MFYETKLTQSVCGLLSQDKVTNLNILGIVENSKEAKIYVDDEKSPTGVLVNDGYFNYIYTEKDEFIDLALKEFFSEKGEYGFSGVKSKIANKIKNRYEIQWANPCTLYYYPHKNVEFENVKSNTRGLNIEEAQTVDEYYTFKDEESIYAIKESIENRPSVCVLKDGELASWLLTHKDNSLGPMYTREEYRKEGYAVDLTLALVDKQINKNITPYLHIENANTPSHKLAKKCGFKAYGHCEWFGIVCE
ncbi:GNAT family N-acetyltransferase [Romboutsia sp.]|uniref:GNAT family N-acetyltransferase n=1 Tax=Romboutsia sp. TaxID=1965302 RepID=UPI003F2A768E